MRWAAHKPWLATALRQTAQVIAAGSTSWPWASSASYRKRERIGTDATYPTFPAAHHLFARFAASQSGDGAGCARCEEAPADASVRPAPIRSGRTPKALLFPNRLLPQHGLGEPEDQPGHDEKVDRGPEHGTEEEPHRTHVEGRRAPRSSGDEEGHDRHQHAIHDGRHQGVRLPADDHG